MDLVSVDIRNFFTIGNDNIVIPLDVKDLVLINGINKDWEGADSNGAGKSLLFEAIVWALWGKTVREWTGDEVVNRWAKRNCRVSVSLRDGGDLYTVTRFQKSKESDKPNDLIITKNGEQTDTHNKASAQQRIDAIVGMDFVTCCAMMPGAKLVAASMTDAGIKELLEKILHTGDLPKALSLTRKELTEQRNSLASLHIRESLLETEIVESKARVKDYNERHKGFRAANEKKIAAIMEKLSTIRASLAGKQEEIAVLEAEMLLGDSRAELAAALFVEMSSSTKTTKLARTSLEKKRRKFAAELAVIGVNTKNAKKALEKADKLKGTCAECRQPVDARHVKALMKRSQKAYDLCLEKEGVVQHRIFEDEKAGVAAVDLAISQEKETAAKYSEASKASSLDAARKFTIQDLEESMTGWEADSTYLAEQINVLENEESGFEDLRRAELKSLKAKQTELKQIIADKVQYETEILRLEFWEKAFAPTGIRSYVLEQVTPILNERAKHYCNIISKGEMSVEFTTKTQQKKKVVEKFQILTSYKHGAGSWKGVSEGEKARANLVISLALGDLAAYRSHKKLKFRFLDEVFSNVDETGSDVIIKLLKDQKKQYGTVFVVTHSPRVQSQFKKKITVTKENSFSTVELDL